MPDMNTGHGVDVVPVYDDIVGDARRPVLVAFGAVAFVLLIACANVAHLLLTRAAVREREVAVRTALGATRRDLVRQFLVESLLLAAAGGVLGVLLASWIVDLLPGGARDRDPATCRHAHRSTHPRRIGHPDLRHRRIVRDPASAEEHDPPASVTFERRPPQPSSFGVGRFASALVVSEMALALVLLIGASLLTQSLVRLVRVEPGFTAITCWSFR